MLCYMSTWKRWFYHALNLFTHSHTCMHTHSQSFIEVEPRRAQKYTLPLFGNLSRAMSTSAMSTTPQGHQVHFNTIPRHFHSFSNPSSMTDLTVSPPRSPNGTPLLTQSPVRPLYMPDANRRQRRASLVSTCSSCTPILPLSSFFLCFSLFSLSPVSYTHLRAHETLRYLVCRLLLEKKK